MIAYGTVPIAPTTLLERLRIETPFRAPLAGEARTRILPFVNYFQRRQSWCWAAVAKSIDRYYDPSSTRTQCDIATTTLGRDCCSESACDVQTSLAAALESVGCYEGGGPAEPDVVRDLIDDERPVGIFIEWTDTSGHFATIIGYGLSARGREFVVADPKYGVRAVYEDELRDGRYRGSGRWTWLYRTMREG
jgi:hypothetical protein